MSEGLPVKVQQTRESIDRAVAQIETCFTLGDTGADQIGRASDLVLDFTKQFGVDGTHRTEAITLRGSINSLLARERGQELSNDDFRVQSVRISRQILELTHVMAAAANSHLDKMTAVPRTLLYEPPKMGHTLVSAALPESDLRRSMEKFLKEEPTDVVFRSLGLSKRYGVGGTFVIQDLDLELKKGEITGVVGLNGSGKTTLLRIIAGSLQATRGERQYPALKCAATNWVTIRRSIAFVAQRPEAWSNTLEEALMLQAACFGDTGSAGMRLVDFYITRLGLTIYRHHTWGQLSGGYRTRFELAKAMLSKPKMLVLDEPLAALDIPTQMTFLTDLKDFATTFAEPMPVLISSQHIYEVEAIADRMVVIRDGKAAYNGPTGALGENRTENGFEVSCDLDVAALSAALASSGLTSIRRIGPNDFFLTMESTVTAREVLDVLLRAGAVVRHFRDTSRSSRMFFES